MSTNVILAEQPLIDQIERGASTAMPKNLTHRLGKLEDRCLIHGRWLDCGCADGGYTIAMLERGARQVIGIDIEADRLAQAQRRPARGSAGYAGAVAEALPFPDQSFDGVLLNEVLEHVASEAQALREVFRVLRPGGHLVLMSPNRWFPFEQHGLLLDETKIDIPIPLLPWLPARIASPFMRARNYWPWQLRELVACAGFELWECAWVFPVFEKYRWLPDGAIRRYQDALPILERLPLLRRFGVSTFILARRPHDDKVSG
ncbi:MAG: methyltransferase domain-containing protein [Roseiflexaceae bacterium]